MRCPKCGQNKDMVFYDKGYDGYWEYEFCNRLFVIKEI